MGIFTSCCTESPASTTFPSLEIYEDTSTSSDSSLKAYGRANDISPLIDGPVSLAFQDLNLSATSTTDIDLEADQIRALLDADSGSGGAVFEDVTVGRQ